MSWVDIANIPIDATTICGKKLDEVFVTRHEDVDHITDWNEIPFINGAFSTGEALFSLPNAPQNTYKYGLVVNFTAGIETGRGYSFGFQVYVPNNQNYPILMRTFYMGKYSAKWRSFSMD